MITSITAWRKALQQGDTLRVINHDYPEMNGIRDVMRVQGNAFTTRYVRPNGEVVESWFYYPKTSEMRLSDDGRTLTRLHVAGTNKQGDPSLSYTVLEGMAAQ